MGVPKPPNVTALRICAPWMLEQAEVRAVITHGLLRCLRGHLCPLVGAEPVHLELFGSLQHGLFIHGMSKINVDITGSTDPHILHRLTAALQVSTADSRLTSPVLVWHRTMHRPVLLHLFWDGIPVHISAGNRAGTEVSAFMQAELIANPLMRLTLLRWKRILRTRTQFLGPNAGQVSTYALFCILMRERDSLVDVALPDEYERRARIAVVACLHLIPRLLRTPDMFNPGVDLTAHAHLAPCLAQWWSQRDQKGPPGLLQKKTNAAPGDCCRADCSHPLPREPPHPGRFPATGCMRRRCAVMCARCNVA